MRHDLHHRQGIRYRKPEIFLGFESHRRQYFCRIRMSTSSKKPVFMRIFASCVWDGSGLEPVFSVSMQHEIQHDAANRSGACRDVLRLQQSRCIGILFRSDCDYDCAGVIIKCIGEALLDMSARGFT